MQTFLEFPNKILGQQLKHSGKRKYLMPVTFFALLIGTIFVVEVGIMGLIFILPGMPDFYTVFLDGFLLTVILFPVLFFLYLRPMIAQINLYQESEKRFRAVFEQTFQFMCILNPDGTILQANQSAIMAGDINHEEIVGKLFWEAFEQFVPPGATPHLRDAIDAAFKGKTTRFEESFGARGEMFVIDVSVKPILDEQGQVVMVILEGHDITHHIRVENKLREEISKRVEVEKRLRLQTTAIKAAANGIIVTNRDGYIEWANPAFMQMTGYTEEELLQQKMSLLRSGLHAPDFYQTLWHTILSGETWVGEIVNRRKDGSLSTEEQTITPVTDDTGNISHFIVIKQDVSERRRSEARLQRQARRAIMLSEILNNLQDVTQDYQPMLDMIVSKTSELLRDACLIRLLSKDGQQLKLTAFHHVHQPAKKIFTEVLGGIGLPSEVVGEWQVVKSGVPLLIPHLTTTGLEEWIFSDHPAFPKQFETHSLMILPLQIRGQPIGTLTLFRDQSTDPYTQEDLDFVQNIALKAVLAVHNVNLYQAEQRSRQTAETLGTAALALTQTLKLEFIFDKLLEYVEVLVPFDTACICLLEDEASVAVRAIRGQNVWNELDQNSEMNLNNGLNLLVELPLLTQRSMLIPDTQKSPGWETAAWNEALRSWLSMPIVSGEKAIGLCILGKETENSFTQDHLQWAEAMVSQAAVAIQNAWLFEQVRTGRERFQSLSHRLVDVQENERRYISRELHDEAGQALTSLMVGLRLIERDAAIPEAVLAGTAELKRVVDEVLENLHRLAVHLRPASLDHLGLIPALQQHIEELSTRHGLMVQFETMGVDARLRSDLETVLYRIVQEALTNVVKHARATRVDVLLERRDERLITIVEDNGVGFDLNAPLSGEHLGLFGIRERLEMFSGGLQLESTPGKGTTLFVEVPYETQDFDR